MIALPIAFVTFIVCWIAVPIFFGLLRLFGFYTTVDEMQSKVYVLFGSVVLILNEPGLHSPFLRLGPRALIVNLFGTVHNVDHRLDQEYLRSQPVNSEEGTPMGIGVWYEMRVGEPVDFLFRNTDPRGSLRANVANATVRCLSNMPLESLLENRHKMSRVVRGEVSPKSESWGYQLGSIYIRKVHFRDANMIQQIEQKVVNRLRQVTSAIRQVGANQVAVIKSTAEKEAASEFARAAAMRPFLVGKALQEIGQDKEILEAVFEILETQNMLAGDVELTLIPTGQKELLSSLLASQSQKFNQPHEARHAQDHSYHPPDLHPNPPPFPDTHT
ncbi:MAG: SPFH domain-containing protein [Candidatus Methylacidiphilales bacterium]|nr:SPFH domain-containing protein [Candidatus Methylacidiphilales bacterium]